MRLLLLLALCVFLPVHLEAKQCKEAPNEAGKEATNETGTEECNETEYTSYVECLRKRMKRSLDCENSVQEVCDNCEDSCQQCDCDYCAVNICQPNCNNCCPHNPPCTTNRCCHKTCHARCQSSKCRSECRRTCTEKVTGGGSSINITTGEKVHHNITTVINLHNIVNNTNIIDMPVHVNNTNINNITLSDIEGSSLKENVHTVSNSSSQKEPCCHVVGPRQCVPTEKYPYVRCFHIRRKLCGSFCKAPIVHEQPHQICDQTAVGTNCHQQIVYIQQPQPRCAYQSTWPYVSCGIQQQPPFCGGCYTHYSSPFPQLPPPGCSPGCYDDGYGIGPYYRQGPFYRPSYAIVPSCYQTGFCDLYGNVGYGVGYPSGYGGGYNGGYGGGYGNPYAGFGYPPPVYAGFPGFSGFPGMSYPPNSYENNVHIETEPGNVTPRAKDEAKNTSNNKVEVEEPPPSPYYPAPMVPQYSAAGYPYPFAPQFPPYKLPPEVDIQATITHPEKESRYAQITISKDPSKRESGGGEKEASETSTEKMEVEAE